MYLRWKGIKRCFRIKGNTRIDNLLAKNQFEDLQPGEICGLNFRPPLGRFSLLNVKLPEPVRYGYTPGQQ